jgi:hypothetical protein
MENNILVLCLPLHSTHLLQPLDIGLFSLSQHFCEWVVDDYMQFDQNEDVIKKTIIISFLTMV